MTWRAGRVMARSKDRIWVQWIGRARWHKRVHGSDSRDCATVRTCGEHSSRKLTLMALFSSGRTWRFLLAFFRERSRLRQGANMKGVNLAGADMESAILRNTNLTVCQPCRECQSAELGVQGANFDGTNTYGADLRRVHPYTPQSSQHCMNSCTP